MEQEYFGVGLHTLNRWGSGLVRVALPLDCIEGVLRLESREICTIPGLQTWIRGVVNQRGSLTWVLDLSQFLELPILEVQGEVVQPAVVVTGSPSTTARKPSQRVACLVSELQGILLLSPEQLSPLPQRLKLKVRRLFQGITETDGERIAVLDPQVLLSTLATTGALPFVS